MRRTVGGGEATAKPAGRAGASHRHGASVPSRAGATAATAWAPAGAGTASAVAGVSSQQPRSAALTPVGGTQHACASGWPGACGAQPHGAGSAATRARPASTAASVRTRPISTMETRGRAAVKGAGAHPAEPEARGRRPLAHAGANGPPPRPTVGSKRTNPSGSCASLLGRSTLHQTRSKEPSLRRCLWTERSQRAVSRHEGGCRPSCSGSRAEGGWR